ncbi:MAG: NADH-quinone oxidoreductase subunit NuoE [Myxococcota bacterium]|jgi:NADH-quinone oxidoreductase subunit E|nr:NADH-quinone oxidoreductase subunit NuoE [Myxococcota bacterium]
MLSDQEQGELTALLAHCPDRRSLAIDGLVLLQRGRGWIADDTLRELAAFLDMTPVELDSIATFYSRIYRRPVGRHVLAVCDSVSCFLLGGERLLSWLERRLGIRAGQTTPDGLFTLLPTVCLGACDRAPNLLVDERLVGDLSEDKLERLLTELADQPDRLGPEAELVHG